ncbi:hypothetical protein BDZ89DRAFT_1042549 [Hymenopellis radicata]|nr:hypothetical protein BDZ89DRAFT_1042549 [Hymenopellis radicata]
MSGVKQQLLAVLLFLLFTLLTMPKGMYSPTLFIPCPNTASTSSTLSDMSEGYYGFALGDARCFYNQSTQQCSSVSDPSMLLHSAFINQSSMSRSQPRLEPDTQFDSDGSREPVALLNVERDLVKFGMQSFYKGSISGLSSLPRRPVTEGALPQPGSVVNDDDRGDALVVKTKRHSRHPCLTDITAPPAYAKHRARRRRQAAI